MNVIVTHEPGSVAMLVGLVLLVIASLGILALLFFLIEWVIDLAKRVDKLEKK